MSDQGEILKLLYPMKSTLDKIEKDVGLLGNRMTTAEMRGERHDEKISRMENDFDNLGRKIRSDSIDSSRTLEASEIKAVARAAATELKAVAAEALASAIKSADLASSASASELKARGVGWKDMAELTAALPFFWRIAVGVGSIIVVISGYIYKHFHL